MVNEDEVIRATAKVIGCKPGEVRAVIDIFADEYIKADRQAQALMSPPSSPRTDDQTQAGTQGPGERV